MSLAEQLIEEGRQEGRQEGLKQGILIGQVQSYQGLLGQGVSPFEVLSALPSAQLRSLARRLHNQLARAGEK